MGEDFFSSPGRGVGVRASTTLCGVFRLIYSPLYRSPYTVLTNCFSANSRYTDDRDINSLCVP